MMILSAVSDVFSLEFLGNEIWRWVAAVLVAIVVYLIIRFIKGPIARKLGTLAKLTKTGLDDLLVSVVAKTVPLFAVIIAIYAGSLVLRLPVKTAALFKNIALVALLVQAALWSHRLLTAVITRSITQRREEDPASASAFSVIGFFARLILWSVVILVGLQNIGVRITALIAGLGVGGIAVALAAQSILQDVFNSVAILLDKPFEVGDFIIVGDFLGTVERIGIKTTRVRSLTGEQLIFSNAELVGSRIKNYGRMQERRILFTIGVTYQTPHEKLEAIPGMIRQVVERVGDRVRFDRAHFKQYGAYSLDFEVVYYVLNRDYNIFMDIQQEINLALHERFELEGIEFAYPTQTLFVAKEEAGAT